MKANRSLRNDEAVSTVVGGIMFFALIVMFLVLVRAAYVPVWEEDREAALMGKVQEQFSSLKAEADRQVNNRTQVSVGNPVTLEQRHASRFFTPVTLPASLEFTPDDAHVTFNASEILLVVQDDVDFVGIDEDWNDIDTSVPISDVGEVLSFRMRIAEIGKAHNDHLVRVDVSDSDGFVGSFQIKQLSNPPDSDLNYIVEKRDNEVLYNNSLAIHNANTYGPHWVDLIDLDYRFDKVLRSGTPPLTLTFTETGFDAEFAITYRIDDGSGSGDIVGDVGLLIKDYERTFEGGTLRYQSANNYYVQQDLLFQNGAVLVSQADGTAFRVEPNFHVRPGNFITTIQIASPGLDGLADSRTDRGTISVGLQGRGQTSFTATSPDLTMNITSEHASLWADFWRDHMEAQGFSEALGHYAVVEGVTGGDSWARVTVFGQSGDPDEHDLNLILKAGKVEVDLGN